MGAPRGIRRRQYKPKSTSGCITCKIRRVKCDEAKPHCHKCKSTGRKCDGYIQSAPSTPLPPSNRLDTIPSLFTRSLSISPQRVLSLSPQLETPEEQLSFHFFASHAVLELPGFFSSSFWKHEVLQAAQRQPAIRYAVIALGAMHRRYITGKSVAGDGDDWELRFALQQSNRAIQEILTHAGRREEGLNGRRKTDRVTIMTSCVLFNCMACLQGHQNEALQHLRSGIKLLREIDTEAELEGNMVEEQEKHPVSIQSLRSIFIGLDLQARSVMSRAHLSTWEPVPRRTSLSSTVSHRKVDGLISQEDVQLHLESTLNEFLAFVQTLSHFQELEDQQLVDDLFQGLKAQAEEGDKMLEEVLSRPLTPTNTDSPNHHHTVIALRLLREVVDLAIKAFEVKRFGLNKCPTPEFDKNAQDRFSSMMDMMSELVGSHESTNTLSKRPVFSFTFGVLATLWWVAQAAPSPTLRLKAIMMMMDHPRREGLWDGPVAGKIAWEAVKLEMESVKEELGELKEGEDVPEYLRVKNIDIEYIGTTGARVVFKNGRDTALDRKGWVRYLTWDNTYRSYIS